MKRSLAIAFSLLVAMTACQKKEEALQPLDEYTSADLQAAGNNFYVYSGARFLPDMTNLFRRAHFVLHPGATTAPPIACYESDATVQQVAEFYAQKYGYPEVAANEVNNFSSVAPRAYYRSGDLAADTRQIDTVLQKLQMKVDISKAAGNYNGAHISPKPDFPRVTIQRPYFDPNRSAVVDKTLILIVKE